MLSLVPAAKGRRSGHQVLPLLSLQHQEPVYPARTESNGLVNTVKFLELICGKDQWDTEIVNYYVALPL